MDPWLQLVDALTRTFGVITELWGQSDPPVTDFLEACLEKPGLTSGNSSTAVVLHGDAQGWASLETGLSQAGRELRRSRIMTRADSD